MLYCVCWGFFFFPSQFSVLDKLKGLTTDILIKILPFNVDSFYHYCLLNLDAAWISIILVLIFNMICSSFSNTSSLGFCLLILEFVLQISKKIIIWENMEIRLLDLFLQRKRQRQILQQSFQELLCFHFKYSAFE